MVISLPLANHQKWWSLVHRCFTRTMWFWGLAAPVLSHDWSLIRPPQETQPGYWNLQLRIKLFTPIPNNWVFIVTACWGYVLRDHAQVSRCYLPSLQSPPPQPRIKDLVHRLLRDFVVLCVFGLLLLAGAATTCQFKFTNKDNHWGLDQQVLLQSVIWLLPQWAWQKSTMEWHERNPTKADMMRYLNCRSLTMSTCLCQNGRVYPTMRMMILYVNQYYYQYQPS